MARDSIHKVVVTAFERDSWNITNDPLTFRVNNNRVMVDLGVERIIGLEKGKEKVAVEIKSFTSDSTIHAYYEALGQYIFYSDLLEFKESDRKLYLAIPTDAYERLQENDLIKMSLDWRSIQLVLVNIKEKRIVQWIR